MNRIDQKKALQFADWVSWVFSPFFVAPLSTLIAVFAYAQDARDVALWGIIAFVVTYFPPVVDVLNEYRAKRLPDLRLLDPMDRRQPYIVGSISALVSTILLWLVGAPSHLVVMSAMLATTAIALGIINYRTKVSLHTASLTGSSVTLGLGVHPLFFGLLVLVPLVGWARITKRRHVLSQVLLGGSLALVIPFVIWYSARLLHL